MRNNPIYYLVILILFIPTYSYTLNKKNEDKPKEGNINITSDQIATIYLTGVYKGLKLENMSMGSTPNTLKKLSQGNYRITLKYEGKEITKTIALREGENLEFFGNFAKGIIALNSNIPINENLQNDPINIIKSDQLDTETSKVNEEGQEIPQEETIPENRDIQDQSISELISGTSASLKDFCVLNRERDTTRYVRQNLIIFMPSDTNLIEEGELDFDGKGNVNYLQGAHGASDFTKVFRSYFPLRRFDTILSEDASPKEFFDKGELPINFIRKNLYDSTANRFLAYSLYCADYIAISRVTSFDGKWSQAEIKKKDRTYVAYDLDAVVKGEMIVFKRAGDAFVKHDRIKFSSGGLLGLAAKIAKNVVRSKASEKMGSGVGNSAAATADALARLINAMDHVSPYPFSDCDIPTRGNIGKEGLISCQGDVESLPKAPGVAGMGVASEEVCTEVDAGSSRTKIAKCAINMAGETFSLAAQKEAISIEGWKLYAPLQEHPTMSKPAISLGQKEGVRKGYGFYAIKNENGEKDRLGYAKVISVGSGGKEGENEPSTLEWKYGKAPLETRMEEHPQTGLSFAISPSLLMPIAGKLVDVVTDDGKIYSAPDSMIGPNLEIGYDLTPYLFSEIWIRANIEALVAPTSTYDMLLFNQVTGPEVRLFMFSRCYWYFLFGSNLTFSSLSTGTTEGTGYTYGYVARTGFDIMFSANFYMRLMAGWMQNSKKIDYYDNDDNQVFTERKDKFSGFSLMLSIPYIF